MQKSLTEGVLPAYVTPIYKKGPKDIAENYRLVSLTSKTRINLDIFLTTCGTLF